MDLPSPAPSVSEEIMDMFDEDFSPAQCEAIIAETKYENIEYVDEEFGIGYDEVVVCDELVNYKEYVVCEEEVLSKEEVVSEELFSEEEIFCEEVVVNGYLDKFEELMVTYPESPVCVPSENENLLTKKRKKHPELWKSNMRKKDIESGKQYVSINNKEVPAKILKPPCNGCCFECVNIFTAVAYNGISCTVRFYEARSSLGMPGSGAGSSASGLSNQDYENNDDTSSLSLSTNNDNDNEDTTEKMIYDKRQLTELIIKYYKEHPVLWKRTKTDHEHIMKHHDAYKNITKMINKEMKLKFKCTQIKGKISKLRSKFRKEQQLMIEFIEDKVKDDNDDGKKYDDEFSSAAGEMQTTSWLYEKMSFLKDHINYERKRSKRGTKALTNAKCYLPLAKVSTEENQQFIELYKSYPCLWDVNHIGFRFKTQRQEGLQELLEVVNAQMNLNLTLDDLQKKLYYIRYAVTQEKHRQIECEKIKMEFKPQCKLYAELRFLQDSVGPFKCEYCEQIFNGPDQYKIHKSTHDGSMPYTCPICKKGFMKVGNCTVHLRRHTKDYEFECKECGKKFPTSTDLNVHSRHHTGEKPYFCDICGQSFRTWTYFDSHRRRHEKNPHHKCSICLKGFYEHNKLKQHMKSHLNVRDKICNVCGKSFTCTKYLNQHKQTHSEKKKYSCKICGKNFAQYGGLSSHVKSHGASTNTINDNNDDIMEDVLESE